MIAVYYSNNFFSKNDKIIVLQVKDDDHDVVLNAIKDNNAPFPDSEIVFIENDQEVNRYRL